MPSLFIREKNGKGRKFGLVSRDNPNELNMVDLTLGEKAVFMNHLLPDKVLVDIDRRELMIAVAQIDRLLCFLETLESEHELRNARFEIIPDRK
jgi:hypothetical protein